MKKILFLLLIFFIKLNAYDFIFYSYNNNNNQRFFNGEDGRLYIYYVTNGVKGQLNIQNDNVNTIWDQLNFIKERTGNYTGDWSGNFITIYKMQKYFEEDNQFLNDLYVNCPQAILNYFYNSNSFSKNNHINYEDYQILYNDDGLAVESIVGGVWKGMYDTPENSGLLYDKDNNILYDNGNVASLFQRFWFSLTGNVSKTLKVYYISMLGLNVFILIVAVYLVKVLLGLIIKWISTIINNTKVNVNLGAQKRW